MFVNVVGPIANKYGPKCFAAGTPVLTSTGYKPIEEIEVGDKVLAYDEETGEQDWKPVVQLFRNETVEWCHVHIDGMEEAIVSTPGHPFYIISSTAERSIVRFEGRDENDFEGQWIAAKDLKIGDKCLLSDGNIATITRIEVEHLSEPETTYNFEVAGFHTYYVGEQGVLVHNACPLSNRDANIAQKKILRGEDVTFNS